MSKTWHEIGITKVTLVLIVYRWIAKAANLCIMKHKLRILFLYEYLTFHLELLTTPTLLMIKISFTSSAQALIRWWWVSMWRKQSLVYHVLNFISIVCLQVKLVAWCFRLSRLSVSFVVCDHDIQSILIHRKVYTSVVRCHVCYTSLIVLCTSFSNNNCQ